MVMKRILFFLSALCWTMAVNAQGMDSLQAIRDVRQLQSGTLASRAAGSRGSREAQYYLMNRFRAIGVLPLSGTYEQPFFFQYGARRIMGTNLMGYIKGTTQDWIVVGAHYDHPVASAEAAVQDSLHPRVGDNASGIAVLLALASWLKTHPPVHNILLVAFDATEEGMQGAASFQQHSDIWEKIRVFVNLDRVGLGPEVMVCGTERFPALKPSIAEADSGSVLRILYAGDSGKDAWIMRADQQPFVKAGIPSLYLTSSRQPEEGNQPDLKWLWAAVRFTGQVVQHLDGYSGVRLPPKNKWIMKQSR